MRRAYAALGQHPIRPHIVVAPDGAIAVEACETHRRRPSGRRCPFRTLGQKPGQRTRGMPSPQRQASQARRIDAANPRQQFYPPRFRRDVIDERRLHIDLRRVSQLPGQAPGVEPIAAGDSSKPGRQQFLAIGARRDRKPAPGHHPAAWSVAPALRRPADWVIDTSGRMRSSPKHCRSRRSLPDTIACSAAVSISRKIRAVTPAVSA